MPQALLPLMMNMLTASMFVACFLTIAYLNPSAHKARWIALSYFLGVLEPASDVAIMLGADVRFMSVVAPGTFLAGLAMMSPALSLFHGKKPMWATAAAIIMSGIAYRLTTLDAPRDSFWYAIGFQAFFALATGLCALTVWRDAPALVLNRALAVVFGITSLHFFAKPFIAEHLGTGPSERYYASTTYALVSQAVTGVMLIAAGLLILITVLQSVVQSNHVEARQDPLTGLPNRRALHERFRALADKVTDAGSTFIAIIDLDHFKAINDRLGHEAGDEVLRRVATRLDESRPSAATIARIGGEEFVMLLTNQSEHSAITVCEGLRLTVSALDVPDVAGISASIGLTAILPGEDLTDSLRRADRALYAAKSAGRDRCEIAFGIDKSRLALVHNAC